MNPGADEVCEGANTDEDCDGLADDADPSASAATMTTDHRDLDGDGYGDPAASMSACDGVTGYVADATDCDDADTVVSPGATEVFDAAGLDEDCNEPDDDAEPGATGRTDWYVDADADAAERYGDSVDDDCDGVTELAAPVCIGYKVPGDYPTLAIAVTALTSSGGTICLGEDTFAGITLPGRSITIIGQGSPGTTVSRYLRSYDAYCCAANLSSFTLTGGMRRFTGAPSRT